MPRFGTRQIGRAPFDCPTGDIGTAEDRRSRRGRVGRQRRDGVVSGDSQVQCRLPKVSSSSVTSFDGRALGLSSAALAGEGRDVAESAAAGLAGGSGAGAAEGWGAGRGGAATGMGSGAAESVGAGESFAVADLREPPQMARPPKKRIRNAARMRIVLRDERAGGFSWEFGTSATTLAPVGLAPA